MDPAGIEIERKFLVAELPAGLEQHPAEPIEQGYVVIGDDGVEVRVRRRAGRSTLTVKSAPGELRIEEEIPIDERQFASLWQLSEGRRISKTRHLVPVGPGLTAELDVYHGPLEGLLTAEVEFPSLAESRRFVPPAWIADEVTGDARYANQSLALDGAPSPG